MSHRLHLLKESNFDSMNIEYVTIFFRARASCSCTTTALDKTNGKKHMIDISLRRDLSMQSLTSMRFLKVSIAVVVQIYRHNTNRKLSLFSTAFAVPKQSIKVENSLEAVSFSNMLFN